MFTVANGLAGVPTLAICPEQAKTETSLPCHRHTLSSEAPDEQDHSLERHCVQP